MIPVSTQALTMGFHKHFGFRGGADSSSLDQHGATPSTKLEEAVSRPEAGTGSICSEPVESKDTKIAVAAFSIHRRVLETVHDVLLASLREDHDMDLRVFRISLRDHAVSARTKRHLESDRQLRAGYTCFEEPAASYEESARSAYTYVHQKLAIAKFMVLQANERTAAAKEFKEQLGGLRKEFGNCIVPGRNGGVREEDCTSEQHALLAEWGLANANTAKSESQWEDGLRDMVRLSVSKEREEKAMSRRAASEKKSKEAVRMSACTQPRRLSVVLESSKEDRGSQE
ncbi:hypothetical protein LZ31DRAFT_340812 [Colletotrichum somersetense]|nr:hypothetical protein LZ31DRAFT_340812 [Colletotrichum somersetense]